jgi:hypothetical protein
MKLTEMNLTLAQDLMNWWIDTSDERFDSWKNPDVLYNALFNDGGKAQFYQIPGVFIIATDIIPGNDANLFQMGLLGQYDASEAKNELINIAREYKLNRLTFTAPSAVNAFLPALKSIGFKHEGRLRYAGVYNGQTSDVDIFGFYSIKPEKHRKRRGRRNGRQKGSLKNRESTPLPGTEQDNPV